MLDKGFGILASIVIVAGMTALVLPGRQTPAVVREGSSGFAKILNAAIGRG